MKNKKLNFSLDKLKNAEFMAVASVILFTAMFAIAAMFTGFDDVWAQIKTISPRVMILLTIAAILNMLLRGARWHIFGNTLGMKKVPLRHMMIFYLAGSAMSVTPGKLGTAIRLWFLRKGYNISYSKSTPLMIMDPITDIVALFLLAILGAFAFSGHGLALGAFSVVLFGMLFLLAHPRAFVKFIKFMYRISRSKKTRRWAKVQRMVKRMNKLASPTVFSGVVLLALIAWMITVLGFYILLEDMGLNVSYPQAAFLFSFPVIVGGATMLPGGLGGVEASMFALLVVMDISPEAAIAAVALIRIFSLWFGVVLGFLLMPLALKLAKTK